MVHQVEFMMVQSESVAKYWTCSEKFDNQESAMKFAQNVAKGFNGSTVKIYYRIVH